MGCLSHFLVIIVGSLRDREVACSASDRQGSNFESCVWRTVSSQSSHHPQEVFLAQFSLYVHKGGLKPDSFHFFCHISFSSLVNEIPSKHKTFTKCWFNAGPPSVTVYHHQNITGSMFGVFWAKFVQHQQQQKQQHLLQQKRHLSYKNG